ncbi:AT-rich interactive domain-containing protein 2-like isoform X2 [Physella acuta]|uniref:AT-rich interactive domain-containing protein 2-like isoform X2 n=1 Tax=Physella acuta TaxID=109671 RepID=UPI0027DB0DAD|nr:AT-rich interactive domain-containing protein 2-like isoform X2 [Physella acuta]
MANISNKEEPVDNISCEYEKQRQSFIADLRRFNANRGTPFYRIPKIGSKEVDLYHLYQRVTSRGGWQKVNYEQHWEDFQEEFGLPKGCVNGAQALKNIYFRYLNLYEKVNFLGEDPDTRNNEEEDGPARKKICLPIETIPLHYNHNQHRLTDAQRQQYNLSTDLYDQKDYEKLELSLRSGLPNEVDMAVNVCVLLSTEGKHCMRLEKTSHMIRLLLAHIGIFEEDSEDMQNLYQNCWASSANRNFLRFWFETVSKRDVKALITWNGKQYSQKEQVGIEVLNVGRDLGTLDVEGQRVLQLAVFLHNLSFEEANQKILANSYLVYKFLMLSLHSSFGGLKQLALDTLANLSCELALESLGSRNSSMVLDLLNNALFSEDRFFLVRGLEILSKVSQLSCNETLLLDHLREDLYSRLVALLTVQDIQLIVHTLEALYKLSKIGEPFTTRIAKVHKAIDTLVSLITIEAQSFGPGSLVGIKVVEYVPPAHITSEDGDSLRKPTTVIQSINPDSVNIYQVPAHSQNQLGLIPDSGGGGSGPGGGELSKVVTPVKETITDIQATTSSWLNATYELKKKSKVNQVELFSDYLQFCRKFQINNAMSSAEFLHLVKVIFHQCEVLSINRKNGDRDVFLEGLCKRPTQRPFAVTTMPSDKVRNPLSVNVSPKQTQSQVVDSLAHTPTLRQRLMEPPRVSLHPEHVHAGPGKGATSLHGKIIKNGKVQQISTPLAKRGLAYMANDNTNSTQTHQNNQINIKNISASQATSSVASQSFPSISQALQTEVNNKMDISDALSVKSLLAKKLSQGISDQEPITNTGSNLLGQPQITVNSGNLHPQSSNSQSLGGIVNTTAVSSSQATLNKQYRPPSQVITSTTSTTHVMSPSLVSSSSTVVQSTLGMHNHTLNPTAASTSATQHVAAPLVHSSTASLVIQPSTNQNTVFMQQSNISTALHNSAVTLFQRNSVPCVQNNQFSVVQQNSRVSDASQASNISIVTQPVCMPLIQQNFNNGVSMVQQASIPCAIMPKTSTLQQISSVGVGTTSQPSSVTFNHLIRNPSSVFVTNPQGSTNSSVTMTSVTTMQGTSVTQSISSPAVAALLSSTNQQGSQMIISSPVIAGGSVVQAQQPVSGQAPTTVVIQTPPGTIVMPSRQLVLQGNGSSFGQIQQSSQGGTVSFIVPSQYRHGVTVQGLNIIQQGSVNMVPSLTIGNTNSQPQTQNLIQSTQNQNILQVTQNPANPSPNPTITNQLGPRQIVLAPNQTTIPGVVQLSGNFIRNTPNIFTQQQHTQQPSFVIQSTGNQNLTQSVTTSTVGLHNVTALPNSNISQHSESLVISDSSVIYQQPQQQIMNSSLVVTDNTVQQQNVLSTQCNGTSHDINGVLASPESVCSDFPPSPLSTGISIDKEIQNGEKDNVAKRCDINKLMEKTSKVNGFVHPVDSFDSNKSNQIIEPESQASRSSTENQGCVLVNGGLHQFNIPSAQVANNSNISNGAASQSPIQGNLTQVTCNVGPQVVATVQQIQPNQQLNIQLPQLASQAQQQTIQLQSQQHTLVQAQPQHNTSVQQPQQNIFIQQNISTQQSIPPQNSLSQMHVISTRSVQSSQQSSQTVQSQLLIKPRISTLPCPPSNTTNQGSNTTVKPLFSRDLSRDSDNSNDSVISASDGDRMGGVNGTTPNIKAKLKAAETPQTTEVLPPRRKKKGETDTTTIAGQQTSAQKPVQIPLEYMCEWANCRRCFSSARLVFLHVFKHHIPKVTESSCQWTSCEKLIRKRWSLVSHVQDHHCSEAAMRTACQRRFTANQNKGTSAGPAPHQPMIYPPDAAMQAIRRFSIKQPYAEFTEQREGPVSKHIRLTAALILRNVCHFSSTGRRLLRRHEQQLNYHTMNAVEASTALSHCLWEIVQGFEQKNL